MKKTSTLPFVICFASPRLRAGHRESRDGWGHHRRTSEHFACKDGDSWWPRNRQRVAASPSTSANATLRAPPSRRRDPRGPRRDAASSFRSIARPRCTRDGDSLKGRCTLGRTGPRRWLRIKGRDTYARTTDITVSRPRSVRTKRLLAEIARDEGGNVEKAATGDPAPRRVVASAKP